MGAPPGYRASSRPVRKHTRRKHQTMSRQGPHSGRPSPLPFPILKSPPSWPPGVVSDVWNRRCAAPSILETVS
ncbi:hypothetical protein M885DRAFT_542143 [Pelagophyceae sp. CCMP2097]|nr:hypothetical protein M885DRAFT_542143 [Pelagophyceae sp. CCMP2097]